MTVRLLCPSLLVLAACSSSSAPPPPAPETRDLQIAEVVCHVPAGQPRVDGGQPIAAPMYGPWACERALTIYLRGKPEERIASIIPIERPLPDGIAGPEAQPGTQAMFVLHAPSGPWPRAGDLAVGATNCIVDPETIDCAQNPADLTAYPKTRFWIPLTQDPHYTNTYRGTVEILVVHDRIELPR